MGLNSIANAVPYIGGSDIMPGRRTGASPDRDVLASRKVGRTVLQVTAHDTNNRLMGAGKVTETGYLVRAIGNASREARTLGSFPTLWAAEQYLAAYSPRFGLVA